MEHLTSLKNPKVQAWRSLKDRKGRKETGCFLVEGRKMVEEALRSAFPVEAVLADEARLAELSLPESVPVYALPEHVLAAVCDTKTPQGVAAVVRMTNNAALGSRLVALDGVLLSAQCADAFSPKVLRATMGSVFRMGIRVTEDLPGELTRLKQAGFSVLSSQLDGTPFYEREPVEERFCLVIGSEGNGVTPQVQQLATHRVKLPMRGGAESLNAAVAAGIMMYELMR